MSNQRLYDQDFYAWANEQAGLLRDGRFSEADMEHIAEEIESMGKTEKRELVSRLTLLAAAPAEVAVPTSVPKPVLACRDQRSV